MRIRNAPTCLWTVLKRRVATGVGLSTGGRKERVVTLVEGFRRTPQAEIALIQALMSFDCLREFGYVSGDGCMVYAPLSPGGVLEDVVDGLDRPIKLVVAVVEVR